MAADEGRGELGADGGDPSSDSRAARLERDHAEQRLREARTRIADLTEQLEDARARQRLAEARLARLRRLDPRRIGSNVTRGGGRALALLRRRRARSRLARITGERHDTSTASRTSTSAWVVGTGERAERLARALEAEPGVDRAETVAPERLAAVLAGRDATDGRRDDPPGDHLLLVDPVVELGAPGLVVALARAVAAHPAVGAATPHVLDLDHATTGAAGWGLALHGEHLVAVPLCAGTDPEAVERAPNPVAAADSRCVLLSRPALDAIRRAEPATLEELAQVDGSSLGTGLSLWLREAGLETVAVGDAVVGAADAHETPGRARPLEVPGSRARLVRSLRLARLRADPAWSHPSPVRIEMHPSDTPPAADEAAERGSRARHRQGGNGPGGAVDLRVALEPAPPPRPAPTVGVIRDADTWTGGWLGEHDALVSATAVDARVWARAPVEIGDVDPRSEIARLDEQPPDAANPALDQLLDIARERLGRPRVAIRIAAPSPTVAERWGDTHFALAFARALDRHGFAPAVALGERWDAPDLHDADVAVHLRGLERSEPVPGALNVLWIVSHPDDVTPDECDQHDLVLVASERFAGELRDRDDAPVEVLLQAADTRLFAPGDPDPTGRSAVLFVGNSRGRFRRAVRWALDAGVHVDLWGEGWTLFVDPPVLRGGHVPNHELPRLYRSADIVLNDHWDDMRTHGFVANRIFDALACGSLVVSDHLPEIPELFGDAVATYESPDELATILERYLEHPDERRERSANAADLVRRHHSFDVRAARFRDLVAPLLPEPLTLPEPGSLLGRSGG